MQQRSLPIMDDTEVADAFEATQTTVAEHCRQLQVEQQQHNDALIAVRQEALRSSLDVQRSRLLELADRPGLNERIRRMRLSQVTNLERRTADDIASLDEHRHVSTGFKVLAGGVADLVDATP